MSRSIGIYQSLVVDSIPSNTVIFSPGDGSSDGEGQSSLESRFQHFQDHISL